MNGLCVSPGLSPQAVKVFHAHSSHVMYLSIFSPIRGAPFFRMIPHDPAYCKVVFVSRFVLLWWYEKLSPIPGF